MDDLIARLKAATDAIDAAKKDCRTFGTGVVFVSKTGNIEHVDIRQVQLAKVRHERGT